MNKEMNFSDRVLQFHSELLAMEINLPNEFTLVNPFNGEQEERVSEITKAFYKKFYNDAKSRRLILGSSPARRGTGITGVPFEDSEFLRKVAGLSVDDYHISKTSADFLFEVIEKCGGRKQFYTNFYMSFVCPLGITRINSKGNEVNCNYYDNKKLQESLLPFIVETLNRQINFGVDTSVCYCIGSGENYKFLRSINEKYRFFDTIIPLEHPRFIMQYNSIRKHEYIQKYLDALHDRKLHGENENKK